MKHNKQFREMNFRISQLTIRLAQCQFGIWWGYEEIINLNW